MAITTLTFVKSYLEIADNTKDARINFLLPIIELGFKRSTNRLDETYDSEESEPVNPAPLDMQSIIAQIIGLDINSNSSLNVDKANGIKSKSIADYSVTYGSILESADKNIFNDLNRAIKSFQKLEWS